MKKLFRQYSLSDILGWIFFSFLLIGCKMESDPRPLKEVNSVSKLSEDRSNHWPQPDSIADGIAMYGNFEDLEPIFNFKNDTTYVINFWATWCKPCIKELPYFEEIDSIYRDKRVKVILVSLDFPNQIESHLVPFVKSRKLESKVVVLLDGKYNDWIDRVSPEWSGAIPATYIYNRNKDILIGDSFESSTELIDQLKAFL